MIYEIFLIIGMILFFVNVYANETFLAFGSFGATHNVSGEQLKLGYSKDLNLYDGFRFILNGEEYFVELAGLTSSFVVIGINGENFIFNVSESKKFDFENDGYYDLEITLLGITLSNNVTSGANVKIILLYEQINPNETFLDINEKPPNPRRLNSFVLWGSIISIIIGIIGFIIYRIQQSKEYREYQEEVALS